MYLQNTVLEVAFDKNLLEKLMSWVHSDHSELQFNSQYFFFGHADDSAESSLAIALPQKYNGLTMGLLGDGPYYIVSYIWQMWSDYAVESRYKEIVIADTEHKVKQTGIVRYLSLKIDAHNRCTMMIGTEYNPYLLDLMNDPEHEIARAIGTVKCYYELSPLKKILLTKTHVSSTEEYMKDGVLVRRNRSATLSKKEREYGEYFLVGDKGSFDQERGDYTLKFSDGEWFLHIGSTDLKHPNMEITTLNGGLKVTITDRGNIDLLKQVIGLALPSGNSENVFNPEVFFIENFSGTLKALQN